MYAALTTPTNAFADAVTCTVTNPSQSGDPSQAQEQVCTSMEDSLLNLAEAREAVRRIHGSNGDEEQDGGRGSWGREIDEGAAAAAAAAAARYRSHKAVGDSNHHTMSDDGGGRGRLCDLKVVHNITDTFEEFLTKYRYTPVIFTLQEHATVPWEALPFSLSLIHI